MGVAGEVLGVDLDGGDELDTGADSLDGVSGGDTVGVDLTLEEGGGIELVDTTDGEELGGVVVGGGELNILGVTLVEVEGNVGELLLGREGSNEVTTVVGNSGVVVNDGGGAVGGVEAGVVANLTTNEEVLVGDGGGTVEGGAVHVTDVNASVDGGVGRLVVHAELTSGGLVGTVLSLDGEGDALEGVVEGGLGLEAALGGHADLLHGDAIEGAEAGGELTGDTLGLEGTLGGEDEAVDALGLELELAVEAVVVVDEVVGSAADILELGRGHFAKRVLNCEWQ